MAARRVSGPREDRPMVALVDLLLELGKRMEAPEDLENEMRARLDPALVDRLKSLSVGDSIHLTLNQS